MASLGKVTAIVGSHLAADDTSLALPFITFPRGAPPVMMGVSYGVSNTESFTHS